MKLKFLVLTAMVSLGFLCAAQAHADMVIKLNNGTEINVPVKEKDVDSISFKSQKNGSGQVIVIAGAQYGAVEFVSEFFSSSRRKFCNAKKALKKLCEGRKNCSFRVDNRLCGDPYPGKGKYLFVEYMCGKAKKTVKADEGDMAVLKCQ